MNHAPTEVGLIERAQTLQSVLRGACCMAAEFEWLWAKLPNSGITLQSLVRSLGAGPWIRPRIKPIPTAGGKRS